MDTFHWGGGGGTEAMERPWILSTEVGGWGGY